MNRLIRESFAALAISALAAINAKADAIPAAASSVAVAVNKTAAIDNLPTSAVRYDRAPIMWRTRRACATSNAQVQTQRVSERPLASFALFSFEFLDTKPSCRSRDTRESQLQKRPVSAS